MKKVKGSIMTRPKAAMSFEKSRQMLLKRMSAKFPGRTVDGVVDKTIRLNSDRVPKFLKRLDQFEKASLKSRLVAR